MGILISLCSFAQVNQQADDKANLDVLLDDPLLSLKYQRGSYLMYDCTDKHWVCTGKSEYNLCLERRKVGILDKNLNLPCGAFTKFKSEKECQKYQIEVINRSEGVSFCVNENNESADKFY